MNVHSFKKNLSKFQHVENDQDDEEDEDNVRRFEGNVEGEEEGDEAVGDDGETLEPFNLKSDRQFGFFDSNMNFVFRKELIEKDTWLAGMDETRMEKSIGEASIALKKRKELQAKLEISQQARRNKSTLEMLLEILQMMQIGESVPDTMRRLSSRTQTKLQPIPVKKRTKPVARSDPPSTPHSSSTPFNKDLADQSSFLLFSELADDLLSRGLGGVYEMNREEMEAITVRWEYTDPSGGVQGPFPFHVMAQWVLAGYFNPPEDGGDRGVRLRKVYPAPSSPTPPLPPPSPSSSQSLSPMRGKTKWTDGEGNQDDSKRVKLDPLPPPPPLSSRQELLDDLEEDEEEGNEDEGKEKADRKQSAEPVPLSSTSPSPNSSSSFACFGFSPSSSLPRGPWMIPVMDDPQSPSPSLSLSSFPSSSCLPLSLFSSELSLACQALYSHSPLSSSSSSSSSSLSLSVEGRRKHRQNPRGEEEDDEEEEEEEEEEEAMKEGRGRDSKEQVARRRNRLKEEESDEEGD